MSPTAGGSQARKRRGTSGPQTKARRTTDPTWVPDGQQDAWDAALAAFPAPEPTRAAGGAQRPAQDRQEPQ